MKLFLFTLLVLSGASHAEPPLWMHPGMYPPGMSEKSLNDFSDDPMIRELEFKGVSHEGIFDAMILKERGLNHKELVDRVVSEDMARLQRRRNQQRLPFAREASYLICDTKELAFVTAVEKRMKNETVDVGQTLVTPNLDDRLGLRLCLSSKTDVFNLLSETNPQREPMRTVLRDAYAALERTEAEEAALKQREANNPAYLGYKKPFRAMKAASAAK